MRWITPWQSCRTKNVKYWSYITILAYRSSSWRPTALYRGPSLKTKRMRLAIESITAATGKNSSRFCISVARIHFRVQGITLGKTMEQARLNARFYRRVKTVKEQNESRTSYEIKYEALLKMIRSYHSFPEGDERKLLVDGLMASYERLCQEQGNPVSQRHYDIILQKYITPQHVGNRELAAKNYVYTRTIARNVHNAMKTLMVLAYGVDGIRWAR